MKPKTILWVVIGVAALAAVVFGFQSSGGGGTQNVDAAGAQAAIDGGAQIIDVRSAGEFEMGHIPGAVNVPVETVGTAAASWDPAAKYLVYCATGQRSATAVQTMEGMGFTDIAHFNAGIQAWTGPLEKGGASTSGQKIETAGKPVMIEFFTNS